MNRLLKNLNDEQTKRNQHYRTEKWADPEHVTKKNVFKMGLIPIKKFKDSKSNFTANYVKSKYQVCSNKGGRILRMDRFSYHEQEERSQKRYYAVIGKDTKYM